MCLQQGRLSPRRWQFSGAGGAGRRWRGQAGGGFGLGLREMAAGGRMEDVSARKWREAGPGTPFFPCWARWAETAEGSHPYPVRPRPGEALPAGGWRRTRGSGTGRPGGSGVRDALALGFLSRVEAEWAARRWRQQCRGPARAPSPRAARVFDPGTGSLT